jgi:hypothetical protein
MDTPLLTNDVTDKPKVYYTRWYVLFCLSLLTCIQNVIWIGYGPVAQSAKAVYDWSDTMVDMLVNFGNIACIIAIIPASWVLDVKGMCYSIIRLIFRQFGHLRLVISKNCSTNSL